MDVTASGVPSVTNILPKLGFRGANLVHLADRENDLLHWVQQVKRDLDLSAGVLRRLPPCNSASSSCTAVKALLDESRGEVHTSSSNRDHGLQLYPFDLARRFRPESVQAHVLLVRQLRTLSRTHSRDLTANLCGATNNHFIVLPCEGGDRIWEIWRS